MSECRQFQSLFSGSSSVPPRKRQRLDGETIEFEQQDEYGEYTSDFEEDPKELSDTQSQLYLEHLQKHFQKVQQLVQQLKVSFFFQIFKIYRKE